MHSLFCDRIQVECDAVTSKMLQKWWLITILWTDFSCLHFFVSRIRRTQWGGLTKYSASTKIPYNTMLLVFYPQEYFFVKRGQIRLHFMASKISNCVVGIIPARIPPKIFPTEVWEFHMPNRRPFLPLPNQFAITVTTPGHPKAWNAPPKTWFEK